jgi:hypothetical protein
MLGFEVFQSFVELFFLIEYLNFSEFLVEVHVLFAEKLSQILVSKPLVNIIFVNIVNWMLTSRRYLVCASDGSIDVSSNFGHLADPCSYS